MDNQIIRECKEFVEANDLNGLQEHYRTLLNFEYPQTPDMPYIFHRVYLHACLKGNTQAEDWLRRCVFPNLDGIQQIALKQIFPYGRHLMSKAKR